jgi:hypothetical protein
LACSAFISGCSATIRRDETIWRRKTGMSNTRMMSVTTMMATPMSPRWLLPRALRMMPVTL